MKQFVPVGSLVVLLITLFVPSQKVYAAGTLNSCLLEALKYADDSVTVGQLREQCREENAEISRDEPSQDRTAAEKSSGGPAEIILKTARARKPAFFPHRRHQRKYTCGRCHHGANSSGRMVKYSDKTVIGKCTSCHNSEMANEELNGFQLIGHKLCRECHRKHQDMTSAKCSTCHKKNLS